MLTTQEKTAEYYDDDPHPNDAVLKAFHMAAEERVPAVEEIVAKRNNCNSLCRESVQNNQNLGEYP
jgi:hypothetical protein